VGVSSRSIAVACRAARDVSASSRNIVDSSDDGAGSGEDDGGGSGDNKSGKDSTRKRRAASCAGSDEDGGGGGGGDKSDASSRLDAASQGRDHQSRRCSTRLQGAKVESIKDAVEMGKKEAAEAVKRGR